MIILKTKDMDPYKIADSGQCFRWHRVIIEKENEYVLEAYFFMTCDSSGSPVCAAAFTDKNDSTGKVLVFTGADEEAVRHYLDLETDYGRIMNQIDKNDAYLTAAAHESEGIRILNQDTWEMMVSYMISQNNNIPRISHSISRLCHDFGDKNTFSFAAALRAIAISENGFGSNINKIIGHDANMAELTYRYVKTEDFEINCNSDVQWYAFPKAAKLKDADFSVYGLGYRVPYLEKLVGCALECSFTADFINEALINGNKYSYPPYLEAKKALKTIYGVGDKVADCICLFAYHMTGAFPVDTWIKKIQDEHYNGAFPVENYPESAGILQQYMFYYERKVLRTK